MKNYFKLLGVVLAATFLLITVSCSEIKGGTIQVTNGLGNNLPTLVIVVKGVDYQSALKDLENGVGTWILAGATHEFKYDEDGIYTIVATPPMPFFTDTKTLALGNTEKVTVK